MDTLTPKILTGQCRTGSERGGRLAHAVPGMSEWGKALCGAQPGRRSNGWSDYPAKAVTCPKCLEKLAKENHTVTTAEASLPTVAPSCEFATWPAYVSPTQTGDQLVAMARAFLEHQHGTLYTTFQAGNAIMSRWGVRIAGYYIRDAFSAMVTHGTAQIHDGDGEQTRYLIP
jgi:hypothetical protein